MPRGRGSGGAGGYQEPSQGAAVSGPGKLSKRTDGPVTQPKPATQTAPSGQTYGARQQQDQLRSAAPITNQNQGGATGSPTASDSGSPITGGIRDKLFAPTSRPGEPITAGTPMGAGPMSPELLPQDPDALLRAAYMVNPDPTLLRFMRDMHS